MADAKDICNIAFRRIGAKRIASMDDTDKEAVIARDLYDEARRDLLYQHNWNFAVRRVALTASATSPTFGWDYAYIIPDDFVRLISVHPADDDDSSIPYRIENQSSDDRVLMVNATVVYIRYVFDLEDVNVMSPGFRDAMALRLARDFAAALGKSAALVEGYDTLLRRKMIRAKAIDGVEDYPEKLAEGSWATIRDPTSDN